jgi:hypothetical protein
MTAGSLFSPRSHSDAPRTDAFLLLWAANTSVSSQFVQLVSLSSGRRGAHGRGAGPSEQPEDSTGHHGYALSLRTNGLTMAAPVGPHM